MSDNAIIRRMSFIIGLFCYENPQKYFPKIDLEYFFFSWNKETNKKESRITSAYCFISIKGIQFCLILLKNSRNHKDINKDLLFYLWKESHLNVKGKVQGNEDFFLVIIYFVSAFLFQDGLRKEQETAFKAWLYTMGIFTCWKWVAWGFGFIVNDMIFIYNIIMTFAWFFFNILNVLSFLCVYSLYLELNDLTKLQDMARLKVSHILILIHTCI